MRGGYIRYSKQYLEQAPIQGVELNKNHIRNEQEKIIEIVNQILGLNERFIVAKEPLLANNLQRQIDATDRQIDQLVYQLYGLTEEEIRIVEGNDKD